VEVVEMVVVVSRSKSSVNNLSMGKKVRKKKRLPRARDAVAFRALVVAVAIVIRALAVAIAVIRS
jgi:hypothetical protein